MKKTFFLFAIIGILQTGSFELNAQKTTQSTSLFSKIDNYLAAGTKNGFSGAIAVTQNGETIINKGYGIANKETNTSINPNTVFDIGSNTKQFTATGGGRGDERSFTGDTLDVTDIAERRFNGIELAAV